MLIMYFQKGVLILNYIKHFTPRNKVRHMLFNLYKAVKLVAGAACLNYNV